MARIVPQRRRGTWEGVPVAIWRSDWICRNRDGLCPDVLIIPASLSLPPMLGAAVGHAPAILQNDWLYTRISNFPISNCSGYFFFWFIRNVTIHNRVRGFHTLHSEEEGEVGQREVPVEGVTHPPPTAPHRRPHQQALGGSQREGRVGSVYSFHGRDSVLISRVWQTGGAGAYTHTQCN